MTDDVLPPDLRAHPRVLVALAVDRYGSDRVLHWCEELLAGRVAVDDPACPRIEWLGGTESWPQGYWGRTWGGRGLLHAGPPLRPGIVLDALADPHWRVREMALKVVRTHHLDDPRGAVEALIDDENDRVRAQAAAALAADLRDAT